MAKLLVHNIGSLVTCERLVKEARYTAIKAEDLSIKRNAWLAVDDGTVVASGEGDAPAAYKGFKPINAKQKLVLPGLVDSHTHPVFGGDRTHEFAARLDGKTYQQIAAAGGGIKYSISQTRAASDEELLENCLGILETFLRHGVTTVEAKSGYGQNAAEEIRCLEVLRKAALQVPQTLSVTCLGLHDRPKEFADNASFIQHMTDELLPEVSRLGLATWVDAFVENGYFSAAEVEPYYRRAKSLGLKLRMHADEFAPSGAAEAAARWGAVSADHMQKASDEGIEALAEASAVAVMLPGTSFYTKIPYADAARFRDKGCAIAVASDFNPGSCYLSNLPFTASLAALYCGLSPYEALVAVTLNAAKALDLHKAKGALAPGYDADFIIHKLTTVEQWIADFGQTQPHQVYCAGTLV